MSEKGREEEEVEKKKKNGKNGRRKKGKKHPSKSHLPDPRHRLEDQVLDESGGLVRRALGLGQRHEPQRERREVRRQAVPDHPAGDQSFLSGGGGRLEDQPFVLEDWNSSPSLCSLFQLLLSRGNAAAV